MAAPQPPVVDMRPTAAESAPPAAARSRAADCALAVPGGTIPTAASGAKRKWMGTHIVPPGPVAAGVGPVAGAPSTLLVRRAAKTPPIPKQRAKKPVAKVLEVKRPMKTPPIPKHWLVVVLRRRVLAVVMLDLCIVVVVMVHFCVTE
jgi:hypothetical protein